jgi:hypothetical protein
VLGVKPGVSVRELKAAHRDLAKVWHPDRFQHDPDLQEKAQEKLKEINEAYDWLSSRKMPRPFPPKAAAQTAHSQSAQASTSRPAGNWKWAVVLLFFVSVFGFTTRSLLQRRHSLPEQEIQTDQQVQPDQEAATRNDSRLRSDATRKTSRDAAAPESDVSSVTVEAPTPTVATVTVTIDPESGLLAKQDCPVRSRLTYPRGSEPGGYCNINHTPPPKESRIKSIVKKILPQTSKK